VSELFHAFALLATTIVLIRSPLALVAEPPAGPAAMGCQVFFRPNAPPAIRPDGSRSERIVAIVRFADGHSESATFPYQWIYPGGEQNDPWSATNLHRGDFDVPVVLPPAGADRTTFPPLIRYILDHTNPKGFTTLSHCDGRDGPRLRVLSSFTTGSVGVPFAIVDASPPDAPVVILKASADGIGGPPGDPANRVCVDFRNSSSRPLTGVRFTFAAVTGSGRVDHVDEALTTQTIPANDSEARYVCTPVHWSSTISAIRAAVAWVRFDDGTTWAAPPASP
jgi:hypothetical protein